MATGLFAPLFKLTDVQNPFVQLMQGFSGDFIKKNPVTVRKFMEDWVTVANYVNDPANRDRRDRDDVADHEVSEAGAR